MGSLADHQNEALEGTGSIADREILFWAEGPSGGGSLAITDEGVAAVAGVTSIDFVGNVTATDGGGGVATVTVPAAPAHPDLAAHVALGLALPTVDHNNETASYVLVLADAGKVVEMEVAGANTLTVPPNGTVAFPVGTVIGFRQYGAGQVTLTPGVGVTIRSRIGLKTAGQYAEGTLTKRATNEWVASGDLAA